MPFPYDPYAPHPMFDHLLATIFQGDADAAEKKNCVQEFVGACLARQATRYSKALVLVGAGRNGKSTLLKIIQSMFPEKARHHIAPQQFGDEYARAELEGVLLNTVAEMPKADIMKAEAFKAIVAGDPIVGRPIREAPRKITPIAGHVFAANTLPGVDDLSAAFWARLIVIGFNRKFEGNAADSTLADRIIAEEMPGIAAWAVAGAHWLLQRGPQANYTIPTSHHAALADWKVRADQVAVFVEDALIKTTDINRRTTGKALYAGYREWAKESGYAPLNNGNFAARLATLGIVGVKPGNERLYPVVFKDQPAIPTSSFRALWSPSSGKPPPDAAGCPAGPPPDQVQ